jgi:hypothetical protein
MWAVPWLGWLDACLGSWVYSQAISCGTGNGQCGGMKGLSLSTLASPCQYHSTNSPNAFSHTSVALYDRSNLQCH